MGDVLVSADGHVHEPPDLWQKRLPKGMRDRALYVRRHGDFQDIVCPGTGASFTTRRFIDVDGRYVIDGVEQRLKNLEDDGIWGEIMFPNYGMIMFVPDHELALAHARAYNDYAAEVFGPHFNRHRPIAPIPLTDVNDAVAEVERVAALGLRGILVPAMPPQRYSTGAYDRVWAAAQANGLVVTFHVGTGFEAGATGEARSALSTMEHSARAEALAPPSEGELHADRLRTELQASAVAQGVFVDLIGSGVLERFPGVHFMAVEFNAYWLASMVAAMEKAYTLGIGQWDKAELGIYDHDRAPGDQPLMTKPFGMNDKWPYPLRPSEYVRRQVHVTFMDDPQAVANRHITGVDALVWGADYPHAEGTWPRSREATEQLFAGVDDAERAAILGGTLARLFDIEMPVAP